MRLPARSEGFIRPDDKFGSPGRGKGEISCPFLRRNTGNLARKGIWMPENQDSQESMSIYRERAHLVAFLTTLYPSVGSYNDPECPDWMVVYVETPVGQMSWHIAPEDEDLFDGIVVIEDHKWDGHSSADKYRKLQNFTRLRRMPASAVGTALTPGRQRLDSMLGAYESKHIAAALRG